MKKIYFFLLVICFGCNLNAQIVNIPNANFKAILLQASTTTYIAFNSAGNRMKIDSNNDGNIQVSEAALVHRLSLTNSSTLPVSDITGINDFSNLRQLSTINHPLASLNLSSLLFLLSVDCKYNLSNLSSITMTNLPALVTLDISNSNIPTVNFSGVPNLKTLTCENAHLTSLDLSPLHQLETLKCRQNDIATLQLHAPNNALKYIDVYLNDITSFNFNAFPSLEELNCGFNLFTSLNIDSLVNLKSFYMENFTATVFPFNNNNAPTFTHLENVSFSRMNFQGVLPVNFNLFPALKFLGLRFCPALPQLNLNIPTLTAIDVSQTGLTQIDLSNLPSLEQFGGHHNAWQSIILNYNAPLNYFGAIVDPSLNLSPAFTSFDLSQFPLLSYVAIGGWNQLESLNIKNGYAGVNQSFSVYIPDNPLLEYICVDANNISVVQDQITANNYINCHANTYCSFNPGGEFYSIQGSNKLDYNLNGCDASDIPFPNLKLNFTSGTTTGTLITDGSGNYSYPLQAGTYTVTPVVLENANYYTASPSSITITLPGTVNPTIQNFCVLPNGLFSDLQVYIIPIGNASPGFYNRYKLMYKNMGHNTVAAGTINFAFDDAVLDYFSSTIPYSSQSVNQLTWNFSNLQPMESREIEVNLYINSPSQTPPVIGGDVLHFTTTIGGITDLNPNNNTATLNQIVTNSFDPNDKICLEGTTIPLAKVGDYVHYRIRFENTGTANAQNIVVKDMIDTTKFDITSLIPLDTSHSFTTRITNTNQVEFIFENIQLPFDDANNDGYVVFKIKTKPTLVLGNTFSNTASIYFDYNFPIVTNTYTTTVAALANQDFEFDMYFSLYPNPTKEVLNIMVKENIEISSISIYNILGQLMMVIPNAKDTNSVDISNLTTGNYFIKIVSDKGTANTKFIKQ